MKINYFILISIIFIACKRPTFDRSNIHDTIIVKSDGAEIPSYVRGNGSGDVFIVVIHGGPGASGYDYRFGNYAISLESKYAMVYWDQRGQGMASGKYKAETVNINQMADDLYNTISVLREEYGKNIKVFLMGHSWGGTLGTAFMLKDNYQQSVAGWIEVDGAHDMPKINTSMISMFKQIGAQQVALGNAKEKWNEIIDYVNTLDTANISQTESVKLNQYAFEAEKMLQEVDTIYTEQREFISDKSPINLFTSAISNRLTAVLLAQEVDSFAVTNQLYKITTPSLILWGKYDFVVPADLGYDAYNNIGTPDKKLVVFQHSGHSPMDTESDLFVDEVVQFIDNH